MNKMHRKCQTASKMPGLKTVMLKKAGS